MMASLQLYI